MQTNVAETFISRGVFSDTRSVGVIQKSARSPLIPKIFKSKLVEFLFL